MSVLIVRRFTGLQAYEPVWQAMQCFTRERTAETADEIWFVEHAPVYTQGQAGRAEHVLDAGGIPLVQSDRGGQITYHGPGQLMLYTLLDCKRLGLGARALVDVLEQCVMAVLTDLGISAHARRDAPGVYITLADQREAKIAALGLRVKKNGCYHGASLNLDCDLAPFAGINPCGYAGMSVARLVDLLDVLPSREQIEQSLVEKITQALHYEHIQHAQPDTGYD